MLTHLTLTDVALIERLELSLDEGLTVITGETGAGKSMLVDALQLVLGGRAHAELIRAGAERAIVEAIFQPERTHLLDALLEEHGIEPDETLIVRRVVCRSGRNKIFVNGCATRLDTLRRLTRGTIDISGQHEHTSLLDPASHICWLDAAAGTTEAAGALASGVSRLRRMERELAAMRERLHERESRADYLRFQLAEFHAIAPLPGEDASLAREAERLESADERRTICGEAAWELAERDDALADRVGRIASRLASLDPEDPLLTSLEGARVTLLDAAAELSGRIDEDDAADPEAIEARRDALARLKRKHRGTLEQVIAIAESMQDELDALESAEVRIDELVAEHEALATSLFADAVTLAHRRQSASEDLAQRVQEELRELGMSECVFRVALSYVGGETPEDADPASLTPTGLDRIALLLAPNPGEGAGPLSRIASGGELSRVLLGLKASHVANDPIPTVVFDEVDAGIGGAVAEAVGRKVAAVARDRQVLCITHHAQLAAFADHHLCVSKSVTDGRTRTEVTALGARARVGELARMLGGEKVTRTTRAHARELVAMARSGG